MKSFGSLLKMPLKSRAFFFGAGDFFGGHCMYTTICKTNNAICGTISLLSVSPFLISFAPPSVSLYLLGTLLAVMVARNLISPFPTPPHIPLIPKSRPLGVSQN
jgi:uncharacterized membrane protein YhhN